MLTDRTNYCTYASDDEFLPYANKSKIKPQKQNRSIKYCQLTTEYQNSRTG